MCCQINLLVLKRISHGSLWILVVLFNQRGSKWLYNARDYANANIKRLKTEIERQRERGRKIVDIHLGDQCGTIFSRIETEIIKY